MSLPVLIRDDFIDLALVLDLCLADAAYMNFSYSQLAAAVLMHAFEPRERVEQLTGECARKGLGQGKGVETMRLGKVHCW